VKCLLVQYKANKRAWMTSEIYEKWLRDVNKSMERQKRNILLFVDNCPAHPKIDRLSNITVVFLSPNTTSHLQPMDQGIIWNFKMNYRRLVIEKLIDNHERKQEFAINVYNAIVFIHRAWRTVTAHTIQNCYRKAGFVNDQQTDVSDDSSDDDIPLVYLRDSWKKALDGTGTQCDLDFDEYVRVDDNVVVAERPSDDDIVSKIMNKDDVEESDEESDILPADTDTPISHATAADCLVTLRRYIYSQENVSEKVFNCVSDLDSFMLKQRSQCLQQPKISDFFVCRQKLE